MQLAFFQNTVFLYVLCVLIWGSTWFAVKMQMGAIAPGLSVAYRFAVAAVLLFALAKLAKKTLKFARETHVQYLITGFFAYCASYILSYKAVEHVTSGIIAVFYSTIPFFNAFLARMILKKPFEKKLLLASAMGFSGVLLIFWNEFSHVEDSGAVLTGLVLSTFGAFASALANTLQLRTSERKVPILQANAYSMAYGAAITFLFCGASGNFLSPSAWSSLVDLKYFLSFSFLVVFGSMISFGAYYTLQFRIGTTRASYMVILFPILALGYSTFLENYVWSGMAFAGLVAVIVGLLLTVRP